MFQMGHYFNIWNAWRITLKKRIQPSFANIFISHDLDMRAFFTLLQKFWQAFLTVYGKYLKHATPDRTFFSKFSFIGK